MSVAGIASGYMAFVVELENSIGDYNHADLAHPITCHPPNKCHPQDANCLSLAVRQGPAGCAAVFVLIYRAGAPQKAIETIWNFLCE